MKIIISFLKEHFTLYVLLLMLISSGILIFLDNPELKGKNLKKESRFAYIAGIVYAVVGIALYCILSFGSA